MKIIVDTKELDEAIEKANLLIELGKEFQKLNLCRDNFQKNGM